MQIQYLKEIVRCAHRYPPDRKYFIEGVRLKDSDILFALERIAYLIEERITYLGSWSYTLKDLCFI